MKVRLGLASKPCTVVVGQACKVHLLIVNAHPASEIHKNHGWRGSTSVSMDRSGPLSHNIMSRWGYIKETKR